MPDLKVQISRILAACDLPPEEDDRELGSLRYRVHAWISDHGGPERLHQHLLDTLLNRHAGRGTRNAEKIAYRQADVAFKHAEGISDAQLAIEHRVTVDTIGRDLEFIKSIFVPRSGR